MLPDPASLTRITVRCFVAVLLGGLIGYEREMRGTAAGLRTHMLVALGAALFVIVPLETGVSHADVSRVLQGVISGIGFLGAGAVIKLSQDQKSADLPPLPAFGLPRPLALPRGWEPPLRP